jgi:hypothetical protein
MNQKPVRLLGNSYYYDKLISFTESSGWPWRQATTTTAQTG